MGVPAFFRWLSKKYPNVILPQHRIPPVDNLYLDMNAIIHPCCHPENGATLSEPEMIRAIFAYIERMISITKPRNLLYLAIDGVAPRAKINQQRSRRFRAAKERSPDAFDSNCITPGTVFMWNIAQLLADWIASKRFKITVILSDSNVPGEGEHKIMDYIREHRDPNVSHCLCGADADLIMLGLASHEPKFIIIREDLSIVESDLPKDFIAVSLPTLRTYLQKELNPKSTYNTDNVVDDWIAMCFLVGNDFLPHLPTLEIHDNAIDTLVGIYKKILASNQYLTDNGFLNVAPYYKVLAELGKLEEAYWKRKFPKKQNSPVRLDKIQYTSPGWKDRYYKTKFNITDKQLQDNPSLLANIRTEVASSYIEGLAWVLHYYFRGPASWEWYYPFHYPPFASDFEDIPQLVIQFEPNTIPLTPFEQLMSVLPPASSDLLPKPLADLMLDPYSPIADFYPTDFRIDMNGKKQAWLGVVLLPFIDQNLLIQTIYTKRGEISDDDKQRDVLGVTRVFARN